MGSLLGTIINLGGLLDGSKTIIGIITVVYVLVSNVAPQYIPLMDEILKILGITLLPLGLADKMRKAALNVK